MMRGQGVWIWQIAQCEGGDIGAIVARAKRTGLSRVVVKIADGERAYNEPLLDRLVPALKDAGVDVWAWQYTYGTGAAGEARYAAERYRRHDFAGFIVDAEKEYKGRPARATAYMEALREELPNETIGFTSYWSPDYHPTLPWREFLRHADINMPQVYWHSRDPVTTLRQAIAQNERYGVPIVPIGAAYPQAASAPEMQMFVKECRAQGLEAWDWWDWQHATGQMWGVIGSEANAIAEPAPPKQRPLADVAVAAHRQQWMMESYAVSSGRRRYLTQVEGYCAAWAGECLAHAYDPTAGANARHSQTAFSYSGIADTADHWGDYLAAGGDAGLGRWIERPDESDPERGDMLFWRAGVAGYPYSAGHVAIVTQVAPRFYVSENSSSRGIGVHPLPAEALETAAGVMRWGLPDVEADDPQPDVAPWAEEAAERLVADGIITGDPDGRLRGYDEMTRNEMFVALDRMRQ